MTAVCASCQAPLAADVLEGLCPRCLLRPALQPSGAATTSAGFTPPSVAELARLFPQLEVLELLGQGGMGAVYRARQVKLDRLVALKVLPPAVAADPGFAERFTREARALARLNHPHIVAVHDFGEVGGLYYLVMEYVDGVNLRQALASGKLEPGQALRLVAELCAALQYAHEVGVVHRDIKPENILLDRQGRVKVADFGLAKLVGQTQPAGRLTASRQAMGTPHYMAPEQWEKPLEVDHRADIYSLGVVFYELLTGELPLGRFPPPSQRAGVDARLDSVVLRAMEKQPEQRYQHMSEMKTAVEAAGQWAPGAAPGGPAPLPPGAVLGIAIAVVGLAVFTLIFLLLAEVGTSFSAVFLLLVLVGLLVMFGIGISSQRALDRSRAAPGGIFPRKEPPPPAPPVPGLTTQEEHLRQVLWTAARGSLHFVLFALPEIDSTVLATARKHCRAAPHDRILAVLDFGGGEGETGLLFGGEGLYWRNGNRTAHPDTGSLSYTELAGRRIVNHGDTVYLGNDQPICPNPDESGIDCEVLASLLYQLQDAIRS